MRLKNLLFWFFSTLLIGGFVSIFIKLFFDYNVENLNLSKYFLSGLTLAAISELGFFSYLVFHWMSKEIFKTSNIYNFLMGLLIAIVLANLFYWKNWVYGALICVASLATSLVKAKLTNKDSVMPTIFFMIVATTVESFPALHPKGEIFAVKIVIETLLVILLCNSWQILGLSKWTQKNNIKT